MGRIDEMQKKLEYYTNYISLIRSFDDFFKPKKIIYHYTSAEGLRGIIENNEIWLTNTTFVNDTTECNALQNEKDLFGEGEITNSFVKRQWESFIKYPDKDHDLFVVSFSENDKSLEQFRSYGIYCIGFDVEELSKAGFYFHKCIYSKEEIKKWIIEKSNLDKWNSSLEESGKRSAAFMLIHSASIKYKNVHYRNEEEIRIIAASNYKWFYPNSPVLYEKCPPIHFRDHQALKFPVPYVKLFLEEDATKYTVEYKKLVQKIEQNESVSEGNKYESVVKKWKLDWEKNVQRKLLPIREVIVGPMPNQQDAKTASEILLYEKGHRDFKVKLSKIPYRGF